MPETHHRRSSKNSIHMAISVCNSGPMARKLNRFNLAKLFLSALIPFTIGLFTVISTVQQQKLSSAQREQDKQDALLLRQHSDLQAENLQKEKVYTAYLDDVSELFTMNNSKDTLMKIRAKTLASLRQLDPERKKHLLLVLYDSELISRSTEKTISSVLKVDEADFNGVYFRGTADASCSFRHLYLHNVYLSNASFINCFIDRSNFSYSIMYKTVFTKARLYRTSFRFASLDKADFKRTTFFEMDFVGASLVECDFTGARWVKQNVMNFIGTNLSGAIISDELLAKSNLHNAILPNGTWGPILSKNLVVNGNAERSNPTMDSTHLTGWRVSVPGRLSFVANENQNSTTPFGKYYFRVPPSYSLLEAVSMSQNISLDEFILLISAGIARYNASIDFQCSGNQYGYIELTFYDMNDLTYDRPYRDSKSNVQLERLQISSQFDREMQKVQIKVGFVKNAKYINTNTTNEENYCIADNIQFFITKAG